MNSLQRFVVLVAAFAVTLGGLVFATTQVINAVERPTSTTTSSMQVDGQTRSWMTILPAESLPENAPIIVVLSGKAASTSQEINRDNFLPYAIADKAELVYPVSIHESWNVGSGCCGWQGLHNGNDVAFLKALFPVIDPGHARPLDLFGYSNGGRMAYDLACTDPGLFNAIVIAKADPMPDCNVTTPQSMLLIAAQDDTFVPYLPSEKGQESPAATVQIARLETNFECGSTTSVLKTGNMTQTSWTRCADGARLSFAVWPTGGHNLPGPPGESPIASTVAYSFFTQTPLAPLPK